MNNKFFKATLIAVATLTVVSGCSSSVMAATPASTVRTVVKEKVASTAADKQVASMDRLKTRAAAEIDRRLTALNSLSAKLAAAKHLTTADKSVITTQIQTEITGLTTLKTKIDADTDIATLRIDVKSIVLDYRVFALIFPKANILITSDRILATADSITSYEPTLQAAIDKAKADGTDVTNWETALADIKTQVESAKVAAQSANTAVASLTPDQFNANKNILKTPRADLENARKYLMKARDEAKTIVDGSKAEKVMQNESKPAKKTSTSSATTY